MSMFDDFKSRFDEEGRFRDGDGLVDVVFAIKSGKKFPGQLHFRDGLCVRAAMDGGGDWALPDGSPIPGVSFLLDFSDGAVHEAVIDQGRVRPVEPSARPLAKRDFLANLRIARNLFVHSQPAGTNGGTVTSDAVVDSLSRAAIWITPRSVAGFYIDEFPELGASRQAELQAAVDDFRAVAAEAPADKPATREQYCRARAAFARILEILGRYLPVPDESERVAEAIRSVEFPPWVVNWDYELSSDSDGGPAVWVRVFADEHALPRKQLGRAASELTSKVGEALDGHDVPRRPYLRFLTAFEHKVG